MRLGPGTAPGGRAGDEYDEPHHVAPTLRGRCDEPVAYATPWDHPASLSGEGVGLVPRDLQALQLTQGGRPRKSVGPVVPLDYRGFLDDVRSAHLDTAPGAVEDLAATHPSHRWVEGVVGNQHPPQRHAPIAF